MTLLRMLFSVTLTFIRKVKCKWSLSYPCWFAFTCVVHAIELFLFYLDSLVNSFFFNNVWRLSAVCKQIFWLTAWKLFFAVHAVPQPLRWLLLHFFGVELSCWYLVLLTGIIGFFKYTWRWSNILFALLIHVVQTKQSARCNHVRHSQSNNVVGTPFRHVGGNCIKPCRLVYSVFRECFVILIISLFLAQSS